MGAGDEWELYVWHSIAFSKVVVAGECLVGSLQFHRVVSYAHFELQITCMGRFGAFTIHFFAELCHFLQLKLRKQKAPFRVEFQ